MKTNIAVNYGNLENDKAVIDRLISENMNGKLDTYLQKFDGEDVEVHVSLTLDKNKQDHFDGSLNVKVDGKNFYYARDNYKKLDDLINHLFDHLKEGIADAK